MPGGLDSWVDNFRDSQLQVVFVREFPTERQPDNMNDTQSKEIASWVLESAIYHSKLCRFSAGPWFKASPFKNIANKCGGKTKLGGNGGKGGGGAWASTWAREGAELVVQVLGAQGPPAELGWVLVWGSHYWALPLALLQVHVQCQYGQEGQPLRST